MLYAGRHLWPLLYSPLLLRPSQVSKHWQWIQAPVARRSTCARYQYLWTCSRPSDPPAPPEENLAADADILSPSGGDCSRRPRPSGGRGGRGGSHGAGSTSWKHAVNVNSPSHINSCLNSRKPADPNQTYLQQGTTECLKPGLLSWFVLSKEEKSAMEN